MKIIKLEQNTEKWLEWRHTKIGASDANAIMGVSPYKKRLALLKEKSKPYEVETKKNTFITDKGHALEASLRAQFLKSTDKKLRFNFKKDVIGQHPHRKYISASFDGIDFEKKIIWECKLIGLEILKDCEKNKKAPEKYYPQLQQQLFVSGFDTLLLTMQDIKNTAQAHIFISKDTQYIDFKLLPELKRANSDIFQMKKILAKNKKIN